LTFLHYNGFAKHSERGKLKFMYQKVRYFMIVSVLAVCILSTPIFAGSDDLKQRLTDLASQTDGRVGICALDVKS
jgi:hypothetical protein